MVCRWPMGQIVAVLSLCTAGLSAWAGDYSPGKGGAAEAGYVDAGIAGFVGPDGEGIVSGNNHVNPVFSGWATGVSGYTPASYLNNVYVDPTRVLGAVTGGVGDIVSLGDMDMAQIAAWKAGTGTVSPGRITLTFAHSICNGSGADFAVFENGFVSNYSTGAGSTTGQMFAELGYVEVSTDGVHFTRFPSNYLNYPNATRNGESNSKIDLNGTGTLVNTGYLTQDVSNIYNLVGKHANAYGISWGTPFNLDDLLDDPLVLSGLIDLNAINYVQIVDIPGSGDFLDANGNPIYDAWVTFGSGGLDLEAVGAINQVPEPGSLLLMTGMSIAFLLRRKTKIG